MFYPDILIDAKQGLMWRLANHLEFDQLKKSARSTSSDLLGLPRLVSFLLQRSKAKMMLIDVLLDWSQSEDTGLQSIGDSFDLINREYRAYLDAQIQTNMALSSSPFYATSMPKISSSQSCKDLSQFASPSAANPLRKGPNAKVILDQADMYSNFFTPLLSQALDEAQPNDVRKAKIQRLISILLEYSRSLEERQLSVQHFLNEILINLLVQNGSWYQLHQLLQYHVIADSKPLACLLLSLESAYPPALQLALDMLTRLGNSSEEICEILLSKNRVLSAIRYAANRGLINNDGLKARKFLEVACNIPREEDRRLVFHSAYTYFNQRGFLQRGCVEYTELFNEMFGSE